MCAKSDELGLLAKFKQIAKERNALVFINFLPMTKANELNFVRIIEAKNNPVLSGYPK